MANLLIGAAVSDKTNCGHSTRNAGGREDGIALEISERLPIENVHPGADDLNLAYFRTGRIDAFASGGRPGLRVRADMPAVLAELQRILRARSANE